MFPTNALIRRGVTFSYFRNITGHPDITGFNVRSTVRWFSRVQHTSIPPALPRFLPPFTRQSHTQRLFPLTQPKLQPYNWVRLLHTNFPLAKEAEKNPNREVGPQDGLKDEGLPQAGITQPEPQNTQPTTPKDVEHNQYEDYPRFFRRLAMTLPHLHRPTRDDFLNATTGFWQRMRIRFKWLTIRSFRKYNADDISGFVTWVIMSQTLWLLVGT